MTDPHPTDALVEKLNLRSPDLNGRIRHYARAWYDENVAPELEALRLARTLLGNILYNVEQSEPACESERRLRESLANTAERIGLSRERSWR